MRRRYDDAVQTGLDVVEGNLLPRDVDLDHLSELKVNVSKVVGSVFPLLRARPS
jgi:hypothetical protein